MDDSVRHLEQLNKLVVPEVYQLEYVSHVEFAFEEVVVEVMVEIRVKVVVQNHVVMVEALDMDLDCLHL